MLSRRAGWLALGLVLALSATLRLWQLRYVPGNLFYDAAVRSMGHSWHAFFFGALEPGAAISIDKPPVDLWLQVASTRVLGYGQVALHLPEALGGVAACGLLFGLLHRSFGLLAAVVGGLALAVLPISVLTARSDTMDSLLAALQIAAVWLSWHSLSSGKTRWSVLAAAVMGVAFNVKLSEALIVLPALILLWAWAAPPRRLVRVLLICIGTFLVVSLSWSALASLTPTGQRPYPIGSATGSIWRLIFVYNGWDRIVGHGVVGISSRVPGGGPGPLRLLDPGASRYGALIGVELFCTMLLGALALGAPALSAQGRKRLGAALRSPRGRLAIGLGVWFACGLVMFSAMRRLEPRYLEAFSPAMCALLGLAACTLVHGGRLVPRDTLVGGGRLLRGGRRWLSTVLALAALAVGLHLISADIDLIRGHQSDSGPPDHTTAALSRFLRTHRDGARFEVVSSNVFDIVGIVARDGLPVLVLDDVHGSIEPLVDLQTQVRRGQARFYLSEHGCHEGPHCPANERWAYAHSTPIAVFPGLRRFLGTDRLSAVSPTGSYAPAGGDVRGYVYSPASLARTLSRPVEGSIQEQFRWGA